MFFTQMLYQAADFNNLLWVESDCGLVQNKHIGISDERLSQTDTLPVAFGKIFNKPSVMVSDFYEFADFFNMRFFSELCSF